MGNTRMAWRAVLLLLASMGLSACSDDDDGGVGGGGPPPPPMTVGDTLVITANPRVISFNRATPGTIRTSFPVAGLLAGERLVGADYRPADGKLYAVLAGGAGGSRVAVLDPATGTLSNPVTLSTNLDATAGAEFGVDFNPVPDRLRVVSSEGQNLRINVADGTTNVDGTLKLDRRTATTADIEGVTAAAYTMSFKEACRTTLYYINNATGMLMTSADPNAGTVFNVGPLGVASVGAVNGFEIVTGTAEDGLPTNTGMAILSSGAGAPTLYTVNLATGAATVVGPIGGLSAGEQLLTLTGGIAPSPTKQARGELLGQTASNKLVSFNRGSPSKLCTGPTAVTGLGGSEFLVGIDTRPATGEVYGLTDASRLVVINPDTGAATNLATLSTALPASQFFFGVDFNPIPDRLRVLVGNGTNLRLDPRSDAAPNTFVDSALSGTSIANVTGAAYSNSLNGGAVNVNTGGTTTLFGIDSTREQLVRIGSDPASGGVCPDATGNPNCGVVSDAGTGGLGIDASSTNGFEIDGVNGQALLASFTGTDTTSQLYSVDLGTGAATPVSPSVAGNTIGGGEHIRGMTLTGVQAVTVFALLENGLGMVTFQPAGFATPSTEIPITGLASDESLVDIDFRVTGNPQRNRQLIGLTNRSRLYVINPTTGLASNGHVLKDSGGGDVTVTGNTAMDFNPVPDLLRVITPTQNLRINVDSTTGGTNIDTAVTGTSDLIAAAYANNYVTLSPRVATTTLYGISGVTASFVRIGADPAAAGDCPAAVGNPNCGVATLIGALGDAAPPPLGPLGDMDIVGGRNGYVLAAVRSAAGGLSRLLRINLATGAATNLGDIATPGGVAVRSIAVRVQ